MNPTASNFDAMQKIGATGVLKGEGVPFLWANQTWFFPDRLVTEYELIEGLRPLYPVLKDFWGASGDYLSGQRFQVLIEMIKPNTPLLEIAQAWKRRKLAGEFTTEIKLTREEVSVLLDELLDPFAKEIDWNGNYLKSSN